MTLVFVRRLQIHNHMIRSPKFKKFSITCQQKRSPVFTSELSHVSFYKFSRERENNWENEYLFFRRVKGIAGIREFVTVHLKGEWILKIVQTFTKYTSKLNTTLMIENCKY